MLLLLPNQVLYCLVAQSNANQKPKVRSRTMLILLVDGEKAVC